LDQNCTKIEKILNSKTLKTKHLKTKILIYSGKKLKQKTRNIQEKIWEIK